LNQAAHFTTDDFSRHSGLIDFRGRCRRSGRLSPVAKSVKPVIHSKPEPKTAVSSVPRPDEIGLARNMPSEHSSGIGAGFHVLEVEDRVRLKKIASATALPQMQSARTPRPARAFRILTNGGRTLKPSNPPWHIPCKILSQPTLSGGACVMKKPPQPIHVAGMRRGEELALPETIYA
jgi:hypothetical protein